MSRMFLYIPFILFAFASCGPSKEETEAVEKAKQDSITLVMQADTVAKQAVKKDSVQEVASEQKTYKHKLAYLQTEYEEACKKLEAVKGHKFLRSKHKKEQQVEEQAKIVADLKSEITALKNQNK